MNRRLFFTSTLIVYIVVVIVGALISVPSDLGSVTHYDKLLHFLEFFVLIIIILKTLEVYNVKNMYIIGIIIAVVLGLLTEIMQLATVSRSFDLRDYIYDILGIIIGSALYYLPRKKS